jgi:hypothetical protein
MVGRCGGKTTPHSTWLRSGRRLLHHGKGVVFTHVDRHCRGQVVKKFPPVGEGALGDSGRRVSIVE